MEGFCRGCLIKYDDPAELLHYTEKNRRLYVYSTGLQVKRNEVLLFQLCKDCYMNMKLACKFKKQCRNTDKRLKSFLSLKESGECSDLCTYLKNNDESLIFKFPLNGNSTPLQKMRDDDNESTCTSIRNFMKDILQPHEIPETEARIIREVIEEEADVLEESLDSHWLQDDISIASDFRLDFSFSPFSTPRSGNNERLTSPKKELIPQEKNEQTIGKNDESFIAAKKIMLDSNNSDNQDNTSTTMHMLTAIKKEIEETEMNLSENQMLPPKANFYIEGGKVDPDTSCIQIVETMEKKDCINRNLEQALKNTANKEFSLDDILATPPIRPGGSGASTPTIANIIFGKKIPDENSNSDEQRPGHCIENYQFVDGSEADVLEDFFNKETGEYIHENKVKDEPELFVEETFDRHIPDDFKLLGKTKYDLSDFSCKICDKRYQNVRALKIHFAKYHKHKIFGPMTARPKFKEVICDICGASFKYTNNLSRHIRRHMNPQQILKCKKCNLEFTGKDKLKMHMTVHTGRRPSKSLREHICATCGHTSSNKHNLHTHMRRHTNDYSYKCETCDRGFYRKNDLEVHMRDDSTCKNKQLLLTSICRNLKKKLLPIQNKSADRSHNGERPFGCPSCPRRFARRDALNRHMKLHTDERPYKCTHCKAAYIKKRDLLYHLEKSKKCLKAREETAEVQRKEDENVSNSHVVTEEIKTVSTPVIQDVTLELPTAEELVFPNLSFIIEGNEEKSKEINIIEDFVLVAVE